ncbi:MAG: hypothetical protein ABR521_01470 [Gaiellaceae bacterium]
MRSREDRELAVRLARVLDGREPGEGEVRELASLLELAAAPARFEVSPDEVERALRAAPAPRPVAHRRPVRRLVLAAGAVAAAAAALLVATVLRSPGLDVSDEALAALGGPRGALRVVERIEPARAGAFPPSIRVGWLDLGRRRALWNQFVGGRLATVTLLEGQRVTRFTLRSNTAIVGPSCRAFASGCAELVDPVELYRRALQRGVASTSEGRSGNRRVYRLRLAVQQLPDSVPIEQVVTIDAETFLPLRIEWRERGERTFSIITVRLVKVVSASQAAAAINLMLPSNVRIVQRVAPKNGVRLLGVRSLSVEQARRLPVALQWLGPTYGGQPVTSVEEFRWNAGRAHRIRYGDALTIWSYGALVPPALAASRYVPAKSIPLGEGIVRFYTTDEGRVVAELERGGRAVALIGPQFGKEDLYTTLTRLRPLR